MARGEEEKGCVRRTKTGDVLDHIVGDVERVEELLLPQVFNDFETVLLAVPWYCIHGAKSGAD